MGLRLAQSLVVLTEVELNYSDESLRAKTVWKVTFLSSPREPNVYNGRKKETGILGIPGMQLPSNEDSLFTFCSTARICKYKSGKQNPKAGT
jgi:hypothetical protein